VTFNDAWTMQLASHDLHNCTRDRVESCPAPQCDYFYQWSIPSSPTSYHESYSYSGNLYSITYCFYGSEASTCSALPYSDYRRFCPCLSQPAPTSMPIWKPTPKPNPSPTHEPTSKPSPKPAHNPTHKPIRIPTRRPTPKPSRKPTRKPSRKPTPRPTPKPTRKPTVKPALKPTPKLNK